MAGRLLRRVAQLLRQFDDVAAPRAPSASAASAAQLRSLPAARPDGSGAFSLVHLLSAAGGLAALDAAHSNSWGLRQAHAEPAQPPAAAAAVAAAAAGAAPTTEADELAAYRRQRERRGLPQEIILYQYEVCPFCNKVRAFLDYHNVPYRTVEVNPLTKAQLKWSAYKKVPVVLLDGEAVNDSSLILSRLAVELEPPRAGQAGKAQAGGWFSRAKEAAADDAAAEAEAEELRWRRWVDTTFVQLLTVNIYRTLRESWQTFDYITQAGRFGWGERQAARVAGAGLMYSISGRLVRKYGIEGDLRQALVAAGDEWAAALGGRRFLGGNAPNLADLSMFGVIRSVTGTDAFQDLLRESGGLAAWYERMMAAVGESSRLPEL